MISCNPDGLRQKKHGENGIVIAWFNSDVVSLLTQKQTIAFY